MDSASSGTLMLTVMAALCGVAGKSTGNPQHNLISRAVSENLLVFSGVLHSPVVS